ncbi:MAG TPA: DUF433 domain-containing protein [Pirellulales bacterium]|nr:DUF433 domain-containing protein [Pirellulales bacterium]
MGDSRVLLELVIHAFQDGATPEAICQRYSSLTLSDVYAVVAYYLRHQQEIEVYLSQRDRKTAEMNARMEARQGDLTQIRGRLQSRRRT